MVTIHKYILSFSFSVRKKLKTLIHTAFLSSSKFQAKNMTVKMKKFIFIVTTFFSYPSPYDAEGNFIVILRRYFFY